MSSIVLVLLGVAVVLASVLAARLPAFLGLLVAAVTVGALTTPAHLEDYARTKNLDDAAARALSLELADTPVMTRVTRAFGDTCAKIGVLIALAAIVGQCLLKSGAAERIVTAGLRAFGERNASGAFLASGFTLGIPVFFDTVFYLMVPLARATALQMGGGFLVFALCITAGASMAHSLVPPTPGPLFVAGVLGVGLGPMILGGVIVGAAASAAGFVYARWAGRRWADEARPEGESMGETTAAAETVCPPLWLSLLPIALPVVLIALRTAAEAGNWESNGAGFVIALGDKNLALGIAAAIALATLVRYGPRRNVAAASGDESADVGTPGRRTATRSDHRGATGHSVQDALNSAGSIVFITAAGGAFGQMLQQTGIGRALAEAAPDPGLAILFLAFGVTAAMRAAQGSATVAMFTSVGIVASAVQPETLGFHPVYVALAIGCGSKPLQWMNDSGFWVVCRMSGMSERTGLKTLTPLLTIMGITGMVVVLAGAILLPLT